MSYTAPRQQLLAAAQAGNITALRAVQEISAADATTALSLVMPILLFHPLVQQFPQLLRGYAECAKSLIDAGADARTMVLRHSGDERVDCRRTYIQLCRTAQEAEATPCDAELVALLKVPFSSRLTYITNPLPSN